MPAITEENRKWWTFCAMCFALFMVMLDNTVANIALPSISRDSTPTVSEPLVAVDAYALSFGVLLISRRPAWRPVRPKRMFLSASGCSTAFSIGAGLSGSISELVFWRAAQGAGAAFLMPGSLSILTNTFHGSERGRALGLWPASPAWRRAWPGAARPDRREGGLGVDLLPQRPVALIAIPVTLYAVRESRDETASGRVDYAGIATLSLGLFLLVLGLVQANDYGWTSTRTLGMFAVAIVSLGAFVALQLRAAEPMVDLGFFKNRTFTAGTAIGFLVSYSMFATFFFITLYMQNALGLSALQTGVRFLPMTLLIIATAPVAGRLSDRFGSRWLLALGSCSSPSHWRSSP